MIKAFLSLPRRIKQAIAVATDFVLLSFAFWSALALRYETWTPDLAAHRWQMVAAPLLAIPIFVRLGLYRAVIRFMEDRVVFVVTGGVVLSVLLLSAGIALTPPRKACLRITLELLNPFAFAVLMYSCPRASNIPARMSRAILAAKGKDKVNAGNTI